MSDSLPVGQEPAEKKARTDGMEVAVSNNNEMDTNEPTILDWLNADVLRVVLDYLSIEDILGSLTVSRRWRDVMVEYLRGSHFCFEHYYLPRVHFLPRLLGLVDPADVRARRSTPFDIGHGDLHRFQNKMKDLGPASTTVILDCLNKESLREVTQNCPNLKEMVLVGLQEHAAHKGDQNQGQQCKMLSFTEEDWTSLRQLQLKRVSFVHCTTLEEDVIAEFIKSDSIEELTICRINTLDGHCLSHLTETKQNQLKSLRVISGKLDMQNLKPIADHLTGLTTLELSNHPIEILQSVHVLLNKTVNLENLYLNSYVQGKAGKSFEELVESLRRLVRLRNLSLCWNDYLCDEWLEAAAQGCKGLLSVDIENKNLGLARLSLCRVTAEGVLRMCRAAPALAHLGVAGLGELGDEALAAVVAACPKLESVDLRGCGGVPSSLPRTAAAVAAAEAGAAGVGAGAAEVGAGAAAGAGGRAAALRLRLARTAVYRNQAAHVPAGLIFDLVDAPRLFRLV